MSDLPTTSAGHGITTSQDVARDVAERIEHLRSAVGRSRIAAYGFFLGPIALSAAVGAIAGWLAGGAIVYFSLSFMPVGFGLHYYRRKALKAAELLRRDRDVSWVSRKDGLIFFGDDGLFVEKRGGFKVYGVGPRRFTDVTVEGSHLVLHGADAQSGATWSLEVTVPDGWNDDDTRRVQAKVAAFVPTF